MKGKKRVRPACCPVHHGGIPEWALKVAGADDVRWRDTQGGAVRIESSRGQKKRRGGLRYGLVVSHPLRGVSRTETSKKLRNVRGLRDGRPALPPNWKAQAAPRSHEAEPAG